MAESEEKVRKLCESESESEKDSKKKWKAKQYFWHRWDREEGSPDYDSET